MGFFSGIAHKSTQKSMQHMLGHFETGSPNSRTGMIFYAWLTRGINLAVVRSQDRQRVANLAELGATPLNIPVYYYVSAAEVPIIKLLEQFNDAEPGSIGRCIASALTLHWYTNLAVSYPNEGYVNLTHRLWEALLRNYTDINEIVADTKQLLSNPDMATHVANNDVNLGQLIREPKLITPHFMVPGHPLSVKLLEEGKAKFHANIS